MVVLLQDKPTQIQKLLITFKEQVYSSEWAREGRSQWVRVLYSTHHIMFSMYLQYVCIWTYKVLLPWWRRNTDVHLRGFGCNNFTLKWILAKENLTAISLIDGDSRALAQNLREHQVGFIQENRVLYTLTWTWTPWELTTSADDITSSKHKAIRLQLSAVQKCIAVLPGNYRLD